jgi:hypothetical protein
MFPTLPTRDQHSCCSIDAVTLQFPNFSVKVQFLLHHPLQRLGKLKKGIFTFS